MLDDVINTDYTLQTISNDMLVTQTSQQTVKLQDSITLIEARH